MKKLLFALLLVAACAPATDREPAAPGTPAEPQTPGTVVEVPVPPDGAPPSSPPQTPREANIYVDSIELGNPVVISGRARTFENNVALRARDARRTVIAEGFTTSQGEMGQHNPFRGTLWLTRHPGDRIIVEALEYSAKDGSEINLVSIERPFPVEPVEARLFFADQSCTNVQSFVRRMPKTVSMARLLVEALIAGPTAEEKSRGAVGAFPQGSRVESVNLRDGVLTVDFNERLQNVGGSCRAQMIRASVTKTLEALPTVNKVVITAAGSEKLALQP